MEYQIIKKPQFTVIGKCLRVATKDGENLRLIPEFWQECMQDGVLDKLAAISGKGDVFGNAATLGICKDFASDMSEFTYMIAAERPLNGTTNGMTEETIPALTWAVFESVGAMPDAIQTVWGKIWSEFFPAGEYIHASGPDVEVYPPGDPRQPDYRFEVWVPVDKK